MIFVFFFFFKQKTAYEITRRDWSSDVCSSDLAGQARRQHERRVVRVERERHEVDALDRKSVVQGKSVPCCVDLGGRRFINKKKIVTGLFIFTSSGSRSGSYADIRT